MKVTINDINSSSVNREEVERLKLIADMKSMVKYIKSAGISGKKAQVFLEPGDSWYDTAIDLNLDKYGLKDMYQKYAFEHKVFQEKVPDAFFDTVGNRWSPLAYRKAIIVFVVI